MSVNLRPRKDLRPLASAFARTGAALVAAAVFASPLAAQSLVAGGLSGIARDSLGRPLPDVTVTLSERTTGVARSRLTPRNGGYGFSLLLPGVYDVLFERFGYRPLFVAGVPVRPAAQIQIDIVLNDIAGRTTIDTVQYPGVPAGGIHLSLGGSTADDRFAALSGRALSITDVADLLPGADAGVGAEGLPGRLGALAFDGVARWSPRHPRPASAWLDGIAFPLAAIHGVELLPGGIDAEWSAGGGGVLAGSTAPGSGALTATVSATAGIDAQTGSLLVGGPIVRDTAYFAFGVAAARLSPELPGPWPGGAIDSGIVAIARDSLWDTLTLRRHQLPWKPATLMLSGFGRFDWILSRDHRISIRANVATATLDDPVIASDVSATLGASVDARDLSVAAQLTSVVGPRIGSEFRVSMDAGSRDFSTAGLVGSVFTEGGLAAGTSDLQPGIFKRTTFRASETAHYRFSFAVVKAGLQGSLTSYDQTYADGRSGMYFFGDSLGFAGRVGAFRQTVGPLPIAEFRTISVALFAQGLIRPTPTLEILVGARYEQEHLPVDQIRLNGEWLRLTGIDNRATPTKRAIVLPRFGLEWTPGLARRWRVSAEAGQFLEQTDPGQIAEAITHASGLSVRRGFGTLGSWPQVPDSVAAPVRGEMLTLMGSRYLPPRSNRLRFGITGNVGGTVLRLQLAYRHTDFLPLRRDLNLPVSSNARDQDGRTLYGALSKSGSLVVATPGGNRRFGAFDLVSTLDPAAASDYYGLTAAIQRTVSRGINVMATYTYSRTTDNWFGARATGPEAQLVPIFDSTGLSTWAQGRSDFDAPHRVVLGTDIGFRRARLAVLYRWRSGAPFTPGFRDGVDVNADGSGRNDPAFVSDTVSGAVDVVAGNSCLRSQVGRIAERNSCREPAVGMLDLRLSFGLGFVRRGAELTFDALGLAASGLEVTDHALYLVDRTAPLVTTPGGVTRVPLVANPNFGKSLSSRDPGATFRVGLRIVL